MEYLGADVKRSWKSAPKWAGPPACLLGITTSGRLLVAAAVILVVGRFAYTAWDFVSSRHVPPRGPAGGITPEEVVASDVTVIAPSSGSGSCRVVAKVTNRASKPLVLPVFNVAIGHPPGEVHKCVASFILAPGETGTFATGGLSSSAAGPHAAYATVTLAYSDPIVESSYVDRQLKYRRMLGLTAGGEFRNDSGLEIDRIQGTVIIEDSVGTPLSVVPFTFEPKKAYPEGYRLGGDYRGPGAAGRRVVEIHSFHEAGSTDPKAVPVAPTVR
ncbi:hypothetical protein OKA05_07105 [Luteolibacter arcticus]|uniref:DUF3426 domain-containing protein n=1 Tax=Luteolibacter arcticus TaxID=1581411 RepID=A0ABT3GFB7_9BACT|nr:hypothetical protein [Luteolibacter arcticus]MCW1922316.1 hypothetical protein [Luteolibacter arcticus]